MRAAKKYHKAWLGLGGNIGAVADNFRYALQRLAAGGCRVKAVSALYRTPAWGKADQADFLNACAEVKTALMPRALLRLCLQVETERKRQRAEKWGPRSLDIDILVYENYQSAAEGGSAHSGAAKLILPHPFIAERAFVLIPLAEIAPNLLLAGQTIAARAAALQKTEAAAGIKKIAQAETWYKKA